MVESAALAPHRGGGEPGGWGTEARRRAAAGIAIAIATLAAAAGCCSVPEASRYFDRKTPFNTLNGFVYAVETGQWDFVYTCLSSADRRRDITPFRLRVAIGFFKDPYGVPLHEIILKSRREREFDQWSHDPRERETFIVLPFETVTPEGIEIARWLHLWMVRESIDGSEELWRIQFEKTIRQAYQPPGAPADRS